MVLCVQRLDTFTLFFIEQRISWVCARTAGVPEGAMDQLEETREEPFPTDYWYFTFHITATPVLSAQRSRCCFSISEKADINVLFFYVMDFFFFNRKPLELVKSKLKTDYCATRSVETFSVLWILWTINVYT